MLPGDAQDWLQRLLLAAFENHRRHLDRLGPRAVYEERLAHTRIDLPNTREISQTVPLVWLGFRHFSDCEPDPATLSSRPSYGLATGPRADGIRGVAILLVIFWHYAPRRIAGARRQPRDWLLHKLGMSQLERGRSLLRAVGLSDRRHPRGQQGIAWLLQGVLPAQGFPHFAPLSCCFVASARRS